jgi:hypothetical protein
VAQVEAHREPTVSPPPEPLGAQARAERLTARVPQESWPGPQEQSWRRPVVAEPPQPLRARLLAPNALPFVGQVLPEPAKPQEA